MFLWILKMEVSVIYLLFLYDYLSIHKAIYFYEQYHLNGWSYQFLDHCLHLDVVIQLQWLRNDCLYMVVEVKKLFLFFIFYSFGMLGFGNSFISKVFDVCSTFCLLVQSISI